MLLPSLRDEDIVDSNDVDSLNAFGSKRFGVFDVAGCLLSTMG